MVRVEAIDVRKPGTGIDKGVRHQGHHRVYTKRLVGFARGLGISANAFHRGKALSCNLMVAYQMLCEHLPDEIRDSRCSRSASVCKASYCQSSSITCVLCIAPPQHMGGVSTQGGRCSPGKSGGTSIGSVIGHYHSSPRRDGLTLMRTPVVKRQTFPKERIFALFPLFRIGHRWHPVTRPDFISRCRCSGRVTAPHTY